MALHPCPDCGREVSDSAPICLGCGTPLDAATRFFRRRRGPKSDINGRQLAIGVAIVGALVLSFAYQQGVLGDLSPRGFSFSSPSARIADQVAEDAVRQYNITAKAGGPMDTCVQAGMVSAAFLQAKDELSYRAWKNIEKTDCGKAGIDR